MLEHTPNGSYGIVINNPTEFSVQSGLRNIPKSMMKAFKDNPLYCGGHFRRLQVLHSFPECGGLQVPLCSKPLYAGAALKETIDFAVNNPNSRPQFHFFAGCCVWAAGKLDAEIAEGLWIPIVSRPDLVVNKVAEAYNVYDKIESSDSFSEDEEYGDEHILKEANNQSSESEKIDSVGDQSRDINNNNIDQEFENNEFFQSVKEGSWTHLLTSIGGEFRDMAQLPVGIDAFNVDSIDWVD
jgi:putative AlgH/UPF0301 family transcriptional regulator